MPLNRDFIGREFPPSPPYEVGREKIREFATAIGDTNPAYTDPEAAKALGHPDVIAPPTFAIILSLGMGGPIVSDPELGLDYSLVVHGEQRFVHTRPIQAGDVLVGIPRITAIRDRRPERADYVGGGPAHGRGRAGLRGDEHPGVARDGRAQVERRLRWRALWPTTTSRSGQRCRSRPSPSSA